MTKLENFDDLWGENAGTIMAACTDVLKFYFKETDHNREEAREIVDRYRKEAMSGTYQQLIQTTREYLYDHVGLSTKEYKTLTGFSRRGLTWLG